MKKLNLKLLSQNIEIDGEYISPIQKLQDLLDFGEKYKSHWTALEANPTKNTHIIYVRDSMRNEVLTIDVINMKNNKYWIVEKLIEWNLIKL